MLLIVVSSFFTGILIISLFLSLLRQMKLNQQQMFSLSESMIAAQRSILVTQELIVEYLKQQNPVTPAGAMLEFYIAGKKVEEMFLKITEKADVTLAVKDLAGNAAKVDGAPAWATTDEALCTVVVAEGGMSAVVTPKGPLGMCKIQVSADADMGEGVKSILGELEVEFLAGEAVSLELSGVASPL